MGQLFAILAAIALTACASGGSSGPYGKSPTPTTGHYKVGKPYKINGKWYRPAVDDDYDRRGVASWYGPNFHGKPTANGEVFDMALVSAAHTTLPLPSLVEVTNLENGRKLVVRVNDRGPFAHNRIIDLSRAAAQELGFLEQGLAKVRVRFVGPASLDVRDDRARPRARETFSPAAPVAPAPVPIPRHTEPVGETGNIGDLLGSLDTSGAGEQHRLEPAGDYHLEIIRLRNIADLSVVEQDLIGLGDLLISRSDDSLGPVYRITMGPFTDLNSAQTALLSVQNAGYAGASLIPLGR